MKSTKKKLFAVCIAAVLSLSVQPMQEDYVSAHSGRTDAQGGHHDNKNKSGLGSYHYHCGGNPAHLHENGVCPYGGYAGGSSAGSSGDTAASTESTGTEENTMAADSNETASSVVAEPASISLSNVPTELTVGESAGIEFSLHNTESQEVTMTSKNETVLVVNADNTITAVGEGNAEIIVSVSDASASFSVVVKSIPVEQIVIKNLPEKIEVGSSQKLEVDILPQNASDKEIVWNSSDENIIEVAEDGVINAKSEGNATISCGSSNGVMTEGTVEAYQVQKEEIEQEDVHIPVTGIKIDTKGTEFVAENTVSRGEKLKISAKAEPADATYQEITWESSNPSVISIVDGEFLIQGIGETTLTAKGNDGISEKITLKVVEEDSSGAAGGVILLIAGAAYYFGIYKKKRR